MREYRKLKRTRDVRAAARQGAEVFKLKVVEVFEGLQSNEMNGLTAAEIVRRIPINEVWVVR